MPLISTIFRSNQFIPSDEVRYLFLTSLDGRNTLRHDRPSKICVTILLTTVKPEAATDRATKENAHQKAGANLI